MPAGMQTPDVAQGREIRARAYLRKVITTFRVDGPPAEYHVLRAVRRLRRGRRWQPFREFTPTGDCDVGPQNTSLGPTQTSQLCLHAAETELEKIPHGFRSLEIDIIAGK